MEFRKSRWIDDDGEKLDEHRHGHYNWHFVHTKHRPLRLGLDYPRVNKIMRSSSFVSLKAFAPFLVDRLIEDHNVDKIGAMADKRGGPLEIYLDKLLEDAVQLALTHWEWDVFDNTKHDEELSDLTIMILIYFCHSCYYIHEILHRMWQWESSYKENKKRDKDKEENIVAIISFAVNTYLHNHLFKSSIDDTWEMYRGMLNEV